MSEVEKVTGSEVEVVNVPQWGTMTPIEFAQALRSGDIRVLVTDEEIQQQMMLRLANASSIEDLLKEAETVKAKNILGQSFTAHSFHLNNSSEEYGDGVYAIIDAELNGKACVISCGGEKVLMQLYKMQYEDWLPADIRIMQSAEKSNSGFHWLYVELGEAPDEPF